MQLVNSLLIVLLNTYIVGLLFNVAVVLAVVFQEYYLEYVGIYSEKNKKKPIEALKKVLLTIFSSWLLWVMTTHSIHDIYIIRRK
jgi:hypothetical protein